MAVINHSKREINAKIVLYGPPDSGKGAFFRYIHQRIKPSLCGPLKSMVTGGDTLLFFDYVPFESSSLDGYRVCFHLYTLTGHVENSGTWKMLLKGVDGLVVVLDRDNLESDLLVRLVSGLRGILSGYGKDADKLPTVVLSNDALASDSIVSELPKASIFNVSDVQGDGALSALAELSRQVMQVLRDQYEEQQQAQPVVGSLLGEDVEENPSCSQKLMSGSECSLPSVILSPLTPVSVRMPVTVNVDGRERRYTLSATLMLEPEETL